MEPLKIGMVGLDTSHCPAFTRLLNDAGDPFHVPGAQVTVAFPGGSPDFPLSRDRVGPYTEQLAREFGVRMVTSCEEVAEEADAILLTAVDGRAHFPLFRKLASYRKPVFIDKPFALSVTDAFGMARLAARCGTPLMSASSLRWAEPLVDALCDRQSGIPVGADCHGPLNLELTQPGLFWYGIHTVEMLYAVMGKGCTRVTAFRQEEHELVVGEWKDGRLGTIRGNRTGNMDFGVMIHGKEGSRWVDASEGRKPWYAGLMERVIPFFLSGTPSVDLQETLEIVQFIEKANESRETGSPVPLERVKEGLA
ncbi:Gfo/Idh/MocA family protein [Salinithrix halophila]|uniref:Gfo/Idh/MocA family protein n=1 Tax=Salinithrix halophila TaxID=1485204 RepID=A0ABV8JDC4_9BACL